MSDAALRGLTLSPTQTAGSTTKTRKHKRQHTKQLCFGGSAFGVFVFLWPPENDLTQKRQ
jgi:hypothetical protein